MKWLYLFLENKIKRPDKNADHAEWVEITETDYTLAEVKGYIDEVAKINSELAALDVLLRKERSKD